MACEHGSTCDECLEEVDYEVHWPAWAARLCEYHKDMRVRSTTEATPPNPPIAIFRVRED